VTPLSRKFPPDNRGSRSAEQWEAGRSGIVERVRTVLTEAGIENAWAETRWIIEAAPDPEQATELARRRASGEPLQYVTGVAGFRHIELAVGPGVLVPRPETELVTEYALSLLPPDGVVADIGTGSGAIALSIASERPDARVYATELSPNALKWAAQNKAKLGLGIVLLEGDLFDPIPLELKGSLDVVVSNPPYVAESERGLLPTEVVDHEPHEALFAGDGLSVIGRLVEHAFEWLVADGWLVLEINEARDKDVAELFSRVGFSKVAIQGDLAGRPRIALGSKPRA
jgi:release factor glutamine methyltransferase